MGQLGEASCRSGSAGLLCTGPEEHVWWKAHVLASQLDARVSGHAQGRMSLGQSVTHGTPQTLWACCALVLGSEAADLALGWPDDLVRLMPYPCNCLCFTHETPASLGKAALHSTTSHLRPVLSCLIAAK